MGTELTTPGGHANITGHRPGKFWDFRTDPGDGYLPKVIQEAQHQGAIFVMNHPFADCTSCKWIFPEKEWATANGIEVWNNAWDAADQLAVDWWQNLLSQGYHLNAYGGTDYHRSPDQLVPATWVFSSSLATKTIMNGLRQGHTVISNSPKSMQLDVTVDGKRPSDTISGGSVKVVIKALPSGANLYVYHQGGLIPCRLNRNLEGRVDLRGAKFLRFELRKGGPKSEMLALTNAFFVK